MYCCHYNPQETHTRHNPWLVTHGLWVWVDAGTGMGTLKSTRRLPVQIPSSSPLLAITGTEPVIYFRTLLVTMTGDDPSGILNLGKTRKNIHTGFF